MGEAYPDGRAGPLARTPAMRTAIVWFRRDLRVHDHPALTAAHREADRVVPLFVLDPRLLDAGRFPSRNRAWFMLESLRELRGALRDRGGRAVRARRAAGARPAADRARSRRGDGPLRVRRLAVRDGARPARDRGARRHRRGAPPPGQLRRRRRQARDEAGQAVRRLQPVLARVGAAAAARRPRRPAHAARAVRPRRRRHPEGAGAGGRRAVPARRGGRPRRALALARRRRRALRRPPRPAGGRHVAALAVPALRLRVGARGRGACARQGRPRDRRVRAPARLARLLRARPAAPPGQRRTRLQAGVRRAGVGVRRRRARGLEGGAHRLSGRRRRDAPAPARGLDAQPGAADRRLVPDEGPAPRLAARRGALHAPPAVRRRGAEQRQLAVDHLDRGRSGAVLPAPLQPVRPAGAPRPGRRRTCAAGAPSWPTCRSRGSPSRGR